MKNYWKAILISIILIIVSISSAVVVISHPTTNYVQWDGIGHVVLSLPLFFGDHWGFRYDIKIVSDDNVLKMPLGQNITLRSGTPYDNIQVPDLIGWGCIKAYSPGLSVNETVGIRYRPSCGYEVLPE